MQPPAMEIGQPTSVRLGQDQPWDYSLRKYLLLLATIVATVTYAAGFNPPGGVWQQGASDKNQIQLAGDPVIRHTYYNRYLAFFYCNATAFAASLVIIVLILIHAIRHDKDKEKGKKRAVWVVVALRFVMVLDLVSLVGAYAAGTCRDKVSACYLAALVAVVFVYIMLLKLLDRWIPDTEASDVQREALKKMKAEERLRKVLMLLATFAVSVTYAAGLSTPGGFWDKTGPNQTGPDHRPGDAILKDRHSLRLTVFLLCNTTAFVASLLTTMLLIIDGRKLREKTARSLVLYACIVIALVSLVGAYAAGSCRKTDTPVYVVSLIGVVLVFILLHGFFYNSCSSPEQQIDENQQTADNASAREALDKARSLVLLLATLAATITYSAGLDPPGGLWQENSNEHNAGDPILLTRNARRYNVFFYCNSVAFVASLVAIILVQNERLVRHHVLEAAMILDLFGLIGAYAAGSCRDVITSIHLMAFAAAVVFYVVIHVVFLDHKENRDDKEDRLLERRRKRLLLFAILAVTITYQAGLTPPGGFLLKDDGLKHHTGDPILLHNYPRRYNAFFYCNSVSFMLSIALIILLVNPILYRPAIRSNALSVCTAVGFFCLMGAYAAGSTQHIKSSIYIFVLVVLVFIVAAGLLLVFLVRERNKNANPTAVRSIEQEPPKDEEERKKDEKEREEDEEERNPVMHDNMRGRYLAFFYSNSISFVASIVVIIMLLPHWLLKKKEECEDWSLRVMNKTIILDLVALLGAYAAGSSRGWKTSMCVVALILAVLGYFAIHMTLSSCSDRRRRRKRQSSLRRYGRQSSLGIHPV